MHYYEYNNCPTSITTYFVSFRGLSKIEYGVVDKFTLKLSVENIGENAFLSKMTVQYEDDFEPIGVKFINVSHSLMKPDTLSILKLIVW